MTEFFLFVLLSFATARFVKFLWHDELTREPRVAVKTWLQLGHIPDDIVGTSAMEEWLGRYHEEHRLGAVVRRKAFELIDCAVCISVWVSGFLVLGLYLFTDYTLPLPWLWWPALSMGAIVVLEWSDGERVVVNKQLAKK